ncbi:MAG: MBL fold metallo-hydrolase [Candidatus Spechtbacteria bacterium SB0662_bin_43]|uniref:MBL fold metallo-hydrolase n=1 Tax=Candidatus Spechtbacteria bacterium SB0662_bin_43 TaxID=2604897 RepID=A0A845DAQ5_9BACT|nr:MBL fold metallo-hydrolase [Candidatus Spechtbacteria bacterium SB0662_bin_43]
MRGIMVEYLSFSCFTMVISWYGQACFKLQSGQKIIIIDPFDKKIGLAPPSTSSADMVLVTHDHFDHNNSGAIKGSPFVVKGAGEYEYQDVRVVGIDSYHDNAKGKERGSNVIYVVQYEGLRVVHMGDLGQHELTDEQIDRIGRIDVLLIPVGSVYTINGKQAAEIVHHVQPRIVIPMHYKIPSLTIDLETAESFLAEMGAKGQEPQEKITVKKKAQQEDERTEVVVLKV